MGKEVKTKTIEYKLLRPITFHKSGETEEAGLLFLKAPSRKCARSSIALKQSFFRAIKSMGDSSDSEDAKDSSEQGLTGDQVMMVLMMSDVDIFECLGHLKHILTHGGAEIDEGVDLPSASYDQLSLTDEEALLGEYLASFLLSFWMKKLKQK